MYFSAFVELTIGGALPFVLADLTLPPTVPDALFLNGSMSILNSPGVLNAFGITGLVMVYFLFPASAVFNFFHSFYAVELV